MAEQSTPLDVLMVLQALAHRYPGQRAADRVGEEMALTWWETGCKRFSASEMNAAVSQYSEMFFPSQTAFCAICEQVRADKRAQHRAELGPAPPKRAETTTEQRAATVRLIREAWEFARSIRDPNGVVDIDDVRGFIAEGRKLLGIECGVETTTCPECDGDLWVPDQDGLRPCQRCNEPGWWLWMHGHRGMDHTCSLCSAVMRGDSDRLESAMTDTRPAPEYEDFTNR